MLHLFTLIFRFRQQLDAARTQIAALRAAHANQIEVMEVKIYFAIFYEYE